MIYTSYIYNLKNLPDSAIKLIIMRILPKNFEIIKYKNTYWTKSLSPTWELLMEYKKNGDWDNFEKKFNKEIESRNDMQKALNKILNSYKDTDIYLICCEKNHLKCHRNLLAQWFSKFGINVIEKEP